MMRKNATKVSFALLMVCTMVVSMDGCSCSSRQNEYQETVAIASRYYNRLEYDKAEEYYLKSIEILPAQEEPYINLYQIYTDTQQPEKAEQILHQAKENLNQKNFDQFNRQVEEIRQQAESLAKEAEEKAEEVQSQEIRQNMNAVYKQALTDLLERHILPNGEAVAQSPDEVGEFAVLDVNGNGIEDLLIDFWGGTMRDIYGYIGEYDPETDSIKTIFNRKTSYSLYTNGYILASPLSPNHGLQRTIFPYQLHVWNPDSGQFEPYRNITKFELSGDPSDDELFAYDLNGDSFVYQIRMPEDYAGEYGEYLERPELDEKIIALTGDIRQIPIEFTELTHESIDGTFTD